MIFRNKKIYFKIGIFLAILIVFFFGSFFLRGLKEEDVLVLDDIARKLESDSDLDLIVEKTKNSKYVLLGESSHGTSEYYKWRSKISKRLIKENNFSFIAVEGDWSYLYNVNKYVKWQTEEGSHGSSILLSYTGWPDWMWANEEFLELVEWLREYNKNLPPEKMVGVYGMDMLNILDSIDSSIKTAFEVNPELGEFLSEQYFCLKDKGENILSYAQYYSFYGVDCETESLGALDYLLSLYSKNNIFASDELFNLKQNMIAVEYGERYGREMTGLGQQSWNTRVGYMKKTVGRLSEKYGDGSKGIIWAHNTHVGDARATEMVNSGMVNIGQLLREKHGESEIFILGFGTHRGTVIAGHVWGGQSRVLNVPPAIDGSVEDFLLGFNMPSFILFFDKEDLPFEFMEKLGHRAKGVVYNPNNEQNNYIETVLSKRYNAFVFIEETSALAPL
jgi:erythromycin esterase-like protein